MLTPTGRSLRSLGSADAATLLVGIVQSLIIARVLGPRNYGTMALSVTFAALVYTMLDPRTAELFPRFTAVARAADDTQALRALVRLSILLDLGLALVAGAVVAASSVLFTGAVLDSQAAPAVPVLAAVLGACAAPVTSARAVLATYDAITLVSRVATVMIALRVFATVLIVWLRPSTVGVMVTLVVVGLCEAGIYAFTSLRRVSKHIGPGLLTAPLSPLRWMRREMVRFTFYAAMSSLVGTAVKYLDVLVVGWARGPVEGGYYRLAKSVTNVLAVPATTAQSVLYPRLSQLAASEEIMRMRRRISRFSLLVGLPLACCTLLCVPLLPTAIQLVAGRDFSPAGAPAMLLVASLAVSALFVVLRPAYLAVGEMRAFLVLTTTTALLSITAFAAVAQPYGASGVATARLVVVGVVGNMFGMLYLNWALRRRASRGQAAGSRATAM
jgi:O-antigen/teichoic acid export membrane protein